MMIKDEIPDTESEILSEGKNDKNETRVTLCVAIGYKINEAFNYHTK